jgi:predicted RNA-binding Zn-ribbon protein involved in translation (DUF1610 family)
MKDRMEYNIIDACPNDLLYYGQHATKFECPECGINIYCTNQVTNKVPYKILRHIPIIPCFEQLLKCKNIA